MREKKERKAPRKVEVAKKERQERDAEQYRAQIDRWRER